MESIIVRANDALETAVSPNTMGIPRGIFQDPELTAVALISVVQGGLFVSGSVGSGIIVAKKQGFLGTNGGWSAPSACGLTGIGFGLLVGASVQDVFVFIFGDDALETFCGDHGIKLGAQSELTAVFGRNMKADVHWAGRGTETTISFALSKGAFIGFSLEGAVVGARPQANALFYGKEHSPMEILTKGTVQIPFGKKTLMDAVHFKLQKLQDGETWLPSAKDHAEVEEAKKAADESIEHAKKEIAHLADDAKHNASNAAHDAKHGASNAMENAGHEIKKAGNRISDAVGNTGHEMNKAAGNAGHEIKKTGNDASYGAQRATKQ